MGQQAKFVSTRNNYSSAFLSRKFSKKNSSPSDLHIGVTESRDTYATMLLLVLDFSVIMA